MPIQHLKTYLFLFISISCFHIIDVSAQNKQAVDSLLKAMKGANDTTRVNIYNQLAWEYRNADLQCTDSFSAMAITQGQQKNYDKGIGQGYVNRALVNRNSGNYDQAIQDCRWALVHFMKAHYYPGYSSAYNTIASVHLRLGDYSRALLYYFQSLRVSDILMDEQGKARTYNNIGVIYMEQHIYDKALIYYNKAYNILEKLKDENGIADCLNNIGSIYQLKNNTDLAIANYEKAIAINKKIGDKKDISSSLNNLGLAYYKIGDYKRALDNYHQSLMIDEGLGDINAIVISYGNIANCYIRLNMYHAASKYAMQSLQISRQLNMKRDVMNAYELLYQIEAENNNFKKALEYHELYKMYSDSIFNKEATERIAMLDGEYQKEKKEKEVVIGHQKQEMRTFIAQEKEKHISEYILLVGLVLMLFVILVYVIFFLIRRNKNS